MTKIKKIGKLLYVVFVMFIFMNIFAEKSVFAFGNVVVKTSIGATLLKGSIVFSEILISGYFTIKFTLTGIQYFTAVAASEKADNRKKLKWTLIYGVSALLAMYLFSYAVGL